MAVDSFGDVWRRVRLAASTVPFALCRQWTQAAYEELCERRPWVWQMRETSLSVLAARSVTVTVTQGSTVATAAGIFLATDVGRQLRFGSTASGVSYPFYTINSVEDASNATLDRPFAAASATQSGTIVSAYVTLPEDFGAFLLVLDVNMRRQIGWWYTMDQLAGLDPTRLVSGDLQRALIPTTLSTAPSTRGRSRSEFWPTPTSARQFPAWYRARPTQLSDTDVFQGVLAQRSKILETGALARCARWPGTQDAKNPYFNLQLAKQLQDDFDQDCAKLELRDDDQAQQTWVALPYHQWPSWGLYGDTTTLRATDATVADYFNYR